MDDTLKQKTGPDDLLIELGCEELPPKALDAIREAFYAGLKAGLENQDIHFDPVGSRSFSSPRRLAALFKAVASKQADWHQERRGPALSAAFDIEGIPTPAATGFAQSVSKDVSDLETIKTEKGEWLFARLQVPGKPLSELIYPILEQVVKQLPVPKPMRWANHGFSFVRPVHWLVVMHGTQVLTGTLLGQIACNTTRGHRVHAPGLHTISDAADYANVLEEACVIADHDRRRELIRKQLMGTDKNVHIDARLLDEVTNLVEWPVALKCSFDEEFLAVPHPALIASMQDHQKFFPIMESNGSGNVSNQFIAVSNLESEHPPSVRVGFERVIRPRLADARFFLQQDMKQSLEAYSDGLDQLVFQKKIGTIGDKSNRISVVSRKIAEILSIDSAHAERAASLCKCDLVCAMVGEFPELQGVMGHHYALASGEDALVAAAIEEHYLPRFSGDVIPPSGVGQVVGIADRLDTLAGIFAAGLRPGGNKDPFGLRRAALGLVRILLEARLDLSLDRLLTLSANELPNTLSIDSGLLAEIRGFIVERARNYYREQGFAAELVNAALLSGWVSLPDLDSRLKALAGFVGQEAASSLAAANKRIGNILRKSDSAVSMEIDTNSFILDEEIDLFNEVIRLEQALSPLLEAADYAASLALLAELRKPVDDFFESVMVMDDDLVLRANRLALLFRLKALFDRIADLSVLS